MADIVRIPVSDRAVVRVEEFRRARAARDARIAAARAGCIQPVSGQNDGEKTRLSVPAAVLAHATSDRCRIRLAGRQAEAFLHLAASEIAPHPDILRIRVNRASSSLIVWTRVGSDLAKEGGWRVVALVSEALRRIALGQRNSAAPIERDNQLGAGLSLLLQAIAF